MATPSPPSPVLPEGVPTSPVPSSAPSTPPKAAGLSAGAKAAIALIVVAVAIVGVLAVGVVPGFRLFGQSSGGTIGVSSAQALSDANQTARSHDAGSLLLIAGISTTYSFSFGRLNGTIGNASCKLTDGLTANLTVPAQTGSYSAGDATLWVFLYQNTTTPSETIIAVVGSTVYLLGQESGKSCVSSTLLLKAISGSYESSTTAAASADGDAGSFLSAHGSANAAYLLLTNNTTDQPEWLIAYTNCSYDPTTNISSGGTKGDLFLAVVNAVTGTITGGDEPGALDCQLGLSGIAGSSEVSLEMVEVAAGGSGSTYYEDLSLSPSSALSTSEFDFELLSPTHTVVTAASTVPDGCTAGSTFSVGLCSGVSGAWYGVLVNVAGQVVATFSGSGWSASASVLSSDTLEVITSESFLGDGYSLTAYATGATSVSGEINL